MSSNAKVDLRLDWCSYQAAKWAVEHWHYSRRMPKSKMVKIWVWEGSEFVGVIIFGVGATDHLCKPYGLKNIQVCELTRIALKKHEVSVSRIVSIAISFLKKQSPSLRLIVSFADTAYGHLGKIYQAGNWVFTGLTGNATEYLFRGRWVHSRSIGNWSKKLGVVRTTLAQGTRKSSLKYRYVYPLDSAMRAQIAPLAKSYPKRGPGEIDSAPSPNSETGGASPTGPLLEST